jgi:hypothetical protein
LTEVAVYALRPKRWPKGLHAEKQDDGSALLCQSCPLIEPVWG